MGKTKHSRKKKKARKKKIEKKIKKKKKYIVHNVNKCMLIYLGENYTLKDLCPEALSQVTLLLTGHGEMVILWSTG